MKKIFKFFPLALAALTLASCSSDDLSTVLGGEDFVKDPNLLYVTVDNGEVTRSGFKGFRRESDGAKGSSVIFYEGDQIKLYDNVGDWRPQVWTYTGTTTKAYRSPNNTVAIFDTEDATQHIDGGSTSRYKSGYGIYPASIASFADERRSTIDIDLYMFRQYDYTRVANADASQVASGVKDIYDNKGILPFWGVADENEMKLNFMTGIGVADISKIVAPSTGNNNYLIIKSTKKLHDTYNKLAFDPVAAVSTDKKVRQDNKPNLIADDATTPTTLGADFVVWNTDNTATKEVGEDIIAIKLDGTEVNNGKGKYTEVYFPIVPGTQTIQVYLVSNVATTPSGDETYKTIDASGAVLIEEKEYDVEAGEYYVFMNNGAEEVDNVNTPQALANAIIALDREYDRDFTLTVKSNVVVKNGTDKNGYVMDFGDYALKHNVTVKFDASAGFVKQVSTPAALGNFLTVITPASDKLLTIEYRKSGSEDLDSIVVNNENLADGQMVATTLQSPLKLTATSTLPIIVNNSNNNMLTVAAATSAVRTKGAMTIDAADKVIDELLLRNQGSDYTVYLNNGGITSITLPQKNFSDAWYKSPLLANDVTIQSTGKSYITTAPTISQKYSLDDAKLQGVAYYKDYSVFYPQHTIYYNSTWDGSKYASEIAASLNSGKIYTAAQLASIDGATSSSYTVMGNITLNNPWTTIATASKNFEGANINAGKYSHIASVDAVYPYISGLTQPLLGVVTLSDGNYVKNLLFKNVNITSIYDRQGALGRELDIAGTVTIQNVDVENCTITSNDYNVAKSYGGVLGMVQATADAAKLVVLGVDVKNVSITANKWMGGIIGQVVDLKYPSVFFGLNSAPTAGTNYTGVNENTVTGLTFTAIETPNTECDPLYKSAGAYVGFFKNKTAANLMLVGESLNYTFTNGNNLYATKGRWGTTDSEGRYITFDVVMPQHLIGYSGNNDNFNANFWSKQSKKFALTTKKSYTKKANAEAATAGTVLYYVADTRP